MSFASELQGKKPFGVWKDIQKIAIVLFCVWQMVAVASYSIPADVKDTRITTPNAAIRWFINPYMFITSQWQQWNLFSPDPLRRVTTYILQTKAKGDWSDLASISRKNIHWSQLSREMKLLVNMENGGDGFIPVRKALLQTYCQMLGLREGTPLRLVYEEYVLPVPATPLSLHAWQRFVPETTRTIDVDVACRAPSL